jgi:peptidoglycan/LPS O-acetylase OafA/YrhL
MIATGATARRELSPRLPDTPYPGLNLLRLVLAAAVLVSHAFPAFGLPEPQLVGRSVGGWAVLGFFALSGFLIARSRRRLRLSSFLARRIGRLMPGYWVCLVVTAVAATAFTSAPILGASGGLSHVLSNALLYQANGDIAGTPLDVPYPGVWNASAWTLPHEFICYVAVGLIYSVIRGFRTWERVLAVSTWLGLVVLQVALPHTPLESVFLKQFSLLAPLFFGGVVVAACLPKVTLRLTHAAVAGVGSALLVVLEPRFGASLAAPLVTVVLLSLGRGGGPGLIQRHDISYGVYLYAFPVSQVLVGLWEDGWSFPAYVLAVGAITATLAVASWVLVERPAQVWVKNHARAGLVAGRHAPAATGVGRAPEVHSGASDRSAHPSARSGGG